ncbi:hypothetical protein Q5Y75_06475 [Ruegeria sp. 2205SS24-7]|uniref:hypothetical protein n=1 Tax=Ruegeria discodermiae TaxID=3064389 RepID=UPI002740446E|nr:hypothetical protein [Ruegeria sp. 2205SS24-7]MDP5216859.1 hypothetical protein [Ruegeria sp. 2205SS24-7]
MFTEDGTDGGGSGESGDTGATGFIAPDDIAGQLDSVVYNPGDPATGEPATLEVTGLPFDDGDLSAEYTRDESLDVPGFQAFTGQARSGSRHYTVLVSEQDGILVATSGSGFRGTFFGGANFARQNTFSRPRDSDLSGPNPTVGNVEYRGAYAGVINAATNGGPGVSRIVRTSGDISVTADFTDNQVQEGTITNRRFEDPVVIGDTSGGIISLPAGTALENLNFESTTLESNGTFTGNVLNLDRDTVGSYAGAFAGERAPAVGGVIRAEGHIEALDNAEGPTIFEDGVFTATR